MDGKINPLMDRKVIGIIFFGIIKMIIVVISPELLDIVWYSIVVIMVLM
jgi:hypothetical protein